LDVILSQTPVENTQMFTKITDRTTLTHTSTALYCHCLCVWTDSDE